MGPRSLSSFLDIGEWSVSCPCRYTPNERPPVPIGWEAGWVWTVWSRQKSCNAGMDHGPASP
jgi:hypothetical protein